MLLENKLIDYSIEKFNSIKKKNYVLNDFVIIKDWERSKIIKISLQEKNIFDYFIMKIIKNEKTTGFNDYAGLKFISELKLKSHLSADFYYGDINESFFIFEDLKTDKNLEFYLNNRDYLETETYFIKLTEQCANLNKITYQKQQKFYEIRDKLPFSEIYGLDSENTKFENSIEKLKKWFDYFKIDYSNITKEIEIIKNKFNTPNKFLSFTNGDMAPSNNLISENKVFLIDFEYCGYRHMFYDILVWETLCPMPEKLLDKIKEKYFDILNDFIDINKVEFEEEWIYIYCWRTLTMLGWFNLSLLDKNYDWAKDWKARDVFISTLYRFYKKLDLFGEFNELKKVIFILFEILENKLNYDSNNSVPKWNSFL